MSETRSMPVVANGRFRNPAGSSHPECSAGGFAGFVARRILHGGKRELDAGHVLPYPEVIAGIEKHRDSNALTWLGHAAFLLRLAGKNIVTDPFLSAVAAPWPARAPRRFAPAALSAAQLPRIDLLLVSHNHYDHLDAPTIKALRRRWDIPVVVPLGLGAFFERRHYSRVTELNWWQSCRVQDLTITAVPAIHFSRRGPTDANKTLWCGFVIEDAAGRRVYFAGDTAYSPVFREIGNAFAPIDCALVPIGAYAPRGIMAGAHVNPEEAAAICTDIGANTAVAMHWGTIVLTEEPAAEPPQRFCRAMRDAGFAPGAVHVSAIGETRGLPLKTERKK